MTETIIVRDCDGHTVRLPECRNEECYGGMVPVEEYCEIDRILYVGEEECPVCRGSGTSYMTKEV